MIKYFVLGILVNFSLVWADCDTQTDDYLAGMCYEKEANLNLAQAAYERVLFEDEQDLSASFALARVFVKLGMTKEAKALLKPLDKRFMNPYQKDFFIKLHEKSLTEKLNFHAMAGLDIGYDSNINASRNSAILDNLTEDSSSKTSTLFRRLSAKLSIQQALKESSPWFGKVQFNAFSQTNAFKVSEYDLNYMRLAGGLGYQKGKNRYLVSIFYDYLYYLNRDLLEAYGIRPQWSHRMNKSILMNMRLLYQSHRYVNELDKRRDDNVLGVDMNMIYIKRLYKYFARAKVERYIASRQDAADFIDKWLVSSRVGLSYQYRSDIKLKTSLGGRYLNFDATTSGNNRADISLDLSLGMDYKLGKTLSLTSLYRYLNNSSNYASAVYDKQELSFGLRYTY